MSSLAICICTVSVRHKFDVFEKDNQTQVYNGAHLQWLLRGSLKGGYLIPLEPRWPTERAYVSEEFPEDLLAARSFAVGVARYNSGRSAKEGATFLREETLGFPIFMVVRSNADGNPCISKDPLGMEPSKTSANGV